MARVTSSVTKRNRHRKILKEAKGYYGHKHIGYRSANEQVRKSKEYAFRDRKNRKREFRRLWIKRINIAARQYDLSYSQLINGLNKANIEINRKMLADIAVNDMDQFLVIVNEAKAALDLPLSNPLPKEEKKVTTTKKVVQKKEDNKAKEEKKEELTTENVDDETISNKKEEVDNETMDVEEKDTSIENEDK